MEEEMKTYRKVLLARYTTFLALMVGGGAAIWAYATYKTNAASVGDIFDRIEAERDLVWVQPLLIALSGAALVGTILFLGCFFSANNRNVSESEITMEKPE